jgi:hypothetical protein
MEREQQNQLPFLDVLLRKKQDGRLAHTVYRKPTHTNRYVNEDSHHHPAQLHSVINTLVTRSLKLADQNHQLEEKKNIRRILIENGYHPKSVDKALRTNNKPPKEKQEPISKAFLPYVKEHKAQDKQSARKVQHRHDFYDQQENL